VLRLDPANEEALEWVGRWIDETGDVDLLSNLMERWTEHTWSTSRRLCFWIEAARTFLLSGRLEESRRALRQVLITEPKNLIALQYLQLVAEREEHTLAARHALIALAEATCSDETAVRLYLDAVSRAKANGDSASAVEYLIGALKRRVRQREVLDSLRSVIEKTGRWRRYAEGLLLALEYTDDAEQLESNTMEFLRIARDRLMDPESAFGPFERALASSLQPSVRFLRMGADLAAELEQWAQAADWYSKARLRSTDEDLRRALGFRLASLFETRLNDQDAARLELNRILEDQPNDAVALQRMVDLELRAGRLGEARVALTRAINATEEVDKRSSLRLRQSELYLNDTQLSAGDQLQAARAGLVTASTETPASAAVYEALANVYGDLSDTGAEQEALRMAVHLTERPADKSRLSERLDGSSTHLTGDYQQRLLKVMASDDPLSPEAINTFLRGGGGGRYVESLLDGLVSPIHDSTRPREEMELSVQAELTELWAKLEREDLRALARLMQLLPPVFVGPPPGRDDASFSNAMAGIWPQVLLAPLPILNVFSRHGGVTLSSELRVASGDVRRFVALRSRALVSRQLDGLSRWNGRDLATFATALGECAGLLKSGSDAEYVQETVGVLEPYLADRSWTEDVFRDVSVVLDMRGELDGIVDRVRMTADRIALVEQGSPAAAMRAYRLAVRGADAEQAIELTRYQKEIARWVVSGEFENYYAAVKTPS
jgi:predicted Zn-dependent protease